MTTKESEVDDRDRELLELAAKAAGIRLHVWGTKGEENFADLDTHARWNPLTDDADALRLAVKLGMQIDTRDPETRIYAMGAGDVVTEYHANRNALAATRLAIVRAAAAIAKGEKE